MPAPAENKELSNQHVSQYTDPKGYFIIVQVIHPGIIEQDMVYPEAYGSECHAVTPYHPVFMCQHIFLFDRL